MERQKKTCRVCGSQRNAKWGKRRGKQCYRCSDCGFQFTIETERQSAVDVKRAVTLYCLGFSFRTIGKLLRYHHTTVMRWICKFAQEHYQKPAAKGEVILELDEMFHFIESKKTNYGFGKHIAAQLDNLSTGNAAIEIPPLLKGCIID